MAVEAIKAFRSSSSENLNKLSPEIIYNNEDSMFEFLTVLKKIQEGGQPEISPKDEEIKRDNPSTHTKDRITAHDSIPEEQTENEMTFSHKQLNKAEEEIKTEDKKIIVPPKQTIDTSPSPIKKLQKKIDFTIQSEKDMLQSISVGIPVYKSGLVYFPCSSLPFCEYVSDADNYKNHCEFNEETQTIEPPSVINQSTTQTRIQPQHNQETIHADIKTKHKIIEWLEQIQLIKPQATTIAEFPGYCRSGILLADLINRLGGRHEKIQGIMRFPKKQTEILSNIRLCLNYLKKFEKMNERCLWRCKEIMDGNPETIYTLLEDIWQCFHGNSSAYKDRSCFTERKPALTPRQLFSNKTAKSQKSLRNITVEVGVIPFIKLIFRKSLFIRGIVLTGQHKKMVEMVNQSHFHSTPSKSPSIFSTTPRKTSRSYSTTKKHNYLTDRSVQKENTGNILSEKTDNGFTEEQYRLTIKWLKQIYSPLMITFESKLDIQDFIVNEIQVIVFDVS